MKRWSLIVNGGRMSFTIYDLRFTIHGFRLINLQAVNAVPLRSVGEDDEVSLAESF